ncbi:MAG TPA: aminoglycoside 6-adenylyltransferase [Pyrinomonadaceae bacterium]|nr:aminoglycoside 6-adenylyltransferase [Pyrinomonadaceae bacterium]
MRTEKEMLNLIVATAEQDERIRAVIMSGSRANPNARRDIFQDFDIVYFVTDVDSFKQDHSWINRFGELMILQMPDAMGESPARNDGRFAYLMQFADGNRIDLTLFPAARLNEFERESLSIMLLDKDQVLEPFPAPSERDFLPVPPTAKAFSDCCNEFWWVCPYVAKGLWRVEIVYAKHLLDQVIREELMKMLTWYIGVRTDWKQSPGKFGKYLQKYLEPDLWSMLEQTYAGASYESTWDSLQTMCELFGTTANSVAQHFGFYYPGDDEANVSAHLKHVRALPRDATEMY